ncbi:MAG: hypothetical protein Ct9H90mP18_05800 [Gammaproteobacteria bacterium]|nr:MAG: hypothetical protein Ct9H90mP18_05800 [Gammaproteobacteria bacterium]
MKANFNYGNDYDSRPVAKPVVMTVADPVLPLLAILRTGALPV